MDQEFCGVTVVAAANVYYAGAVTSRTVRFADGSEKTLGVMLPGEYEFGTQRAEQMDVLRGRADVQLAGESAWKTVLGGDTFHVPGSSKFRVKVHELVDYVCSFLDE